MLPPLLGKRAVLRPRWCRTAGGPCPGNEGREHQRSTHKGSSTSGKATAS